MRDAKERTAWSVALAGNFPAMRQNDLLNNGQAQPGALFVRGEIRFENLRAPFGGNTRSIVADFQSGFGSITKSPDPNSAS